MHTHTPTPTPAPAHSLDHLKNVLYRVLGIGQLEHHLKHLGLEPWLGVFNLDIPRVGGIKSSYGRSEMGSCSAVSLVSVLVLSGPH